MVATVVSPSTLGSPTADPSPAGAPPSLLGSVHDKIHDESDWMNFYDGPGGEEEDIYYLLEELAKDQFPDGLSNSGRPKWTVDKSGKDVVVTFGESREMVWNIAKDEITAYRNRVKELTKKDFHDIDPIKEVMDLFLGKAKPIMQLMESSLGLSYEKVCHFLGTYCIQKAYRLSVAELYDDEDDGRIKTSDLMSEEEYRNVWTLISKNPSSGESRKKKTFWEKYQDRMNEAFNDVNVLMLGSLLVSLDDDKKKASIGKGKDMQGLKQHVLTDRRKGIVGHTAVSPATLLTLGVCWEMEGESSYDCYIKLVKEIFGTNPNLDKVTFCSDRGYWILDVVKYLLAHRADIQGTVRRQHWYGLTFDTALKDGDTRLNVDKLGPATLYTAEAEIEGRRVSINGFRNGTGGVATTMSSLIHGPAWECVVKDSMRVSTKIPEGTSPERRQALLFRPAGSNTVLDDETLSTLGSLTIDHVTEFQGHPEWFIARKVSITSTGVSVQFPIQLKIDKERDERQQHWVALEQYLDTSCGVGDDEASVESNQDIVVVETEDSTVVAAVSNGTALRARGQLWRPDWSFF